MGGKKVKKWAERTGPRVVEAVGDGWGAPGSSEPLRRRRQPPTAADVISAPNAQTSESRFSSQKVPLWRSPSQSDGDESFGKWKTSDQTTGHEKGGDGGRGRGGGI